MLYALLTYPEVFGHESIDEGIDATRGIFVIKLKLNIKDYCSCLEELFAKTMSNSISPVEVCE